MGKFTDALSNLIDLRVNLNYVTLNLLTRRVLWMD